jgi:hypothetical protein
MVISDGIPGVPRKRKPRNSVPNPSAEEKTTRNSVPLNKNRSKLSEFPSEPFSRKENNWDSVPWNQIEANSRNPPGIPFRTLLRKRKQLGIPLRGRKIRNKLSEFRSELFRGRENYSEPVLLNVYGAPELIPRNEFRQPM